MERRTAHVPMDYEYANGTGPVDESSPFITASRMAQNRKRDHNALNSPAKPQTPSLRPPASQQTFLFSNPAGSSKPLPAVPSHMKDPKFHTPRKLDTDFSSGGETPDTVGENADSEATPDSFMGFRDRVAQFTSGGKRSPQKSPSKEKRRDSWWNRALGSPGRGERELVKAPYSTKVERRVMKKRTASAKSRDRDRDGRRRHPDDEDDEDGARTRRSSADTTAGAHPPDQSSIIAAIFSYIETHPNLPHILSYYAQLLLNFFIVFVIIYAVYTFWTAIKGDVDLESERAVAETLAEMAICAANYRENRCEPATRMPALAVVCENWEKCMKRDPKAVGRARVSAHTFAQIFNSFIEPISYKAMLFCIIIIFGCVAMSNLAFGFFRNKHAQHHPQGNAQQYPQHPQHQQPQYIPPTPHRYPSGSVYDQGGFWTPHPQQQWALGQGELEPQASGSPVKRLGY